MPAASPRLIWFKECLRFILLMALAVGIGWTLHHVAIALVVALTCYIAVHLRYAYQLHLWLLSDNSPPSDGLGVWQDIFTELYRLRQRNRRRKHRLRKIVSEFQASTAALPDGAVVLDPIGRIVWFNSAAAALLALRSPQDKGQRIVNLLRHPSFSRFIGAHGDEHEQLEMPSPASDAVTIVVRIVPYGEGQRLMIARDVSEQKRLDVTRRDFVANASHELRTPLTVLRGYLEMMSEETAGEGGLAGWRVPIREMNGQAHRMSRIIDSLLKLARVETQGLAQRQEEVDVPAMLDSLVRDAQAAKASLPHVFAFEIDPELALFGRRNELESVFSNLISNAVRYTPANGRISVRWQRDGNTALFSVSDTGPGISAVHIPRLTERFYRVDAGRKASSGGTGLGLAIVKHCLEHHESELLIESTPGDGATFSCRFPTQRIVRLETV